MPPASLGDAATFVNETVGHTTTLEGFDIYANKVEIITESKVRIRDGY